MGNKRSPEAASSDAQTRSTVLLEQAIGGALKRWVNHLAGRIDPKANFGR